MARKFFGTDGIRGRTNHAKMNAELAMRVGQAAVVDPVSLPFLKGSEIAFVDDLSGAQFVVRNPNAASSCGCGVSFSI